MIIGEVYFNGKNLKDMGVYVTNAGAYIAPQKVYNVKKVPGRNGDFLFDTEKYENVNITYPAFIYENFEVNVNALRNFLLSTSGYCRLEDSFHPDEYRLASYQDDFKLSSLKGDKKGAFDLVFNCKPQRFLKSGEEFNTYTSNFTLYSPYSFPSKPIIRVYGVGTFVVGDNTITVSSHSGIPYIDMDCDLKDCYYNGTNCNNYVSFSTDDFPVLKESTLFTFGSGITRLDVMPRWYRL